MTDGSKPSATKGRNPAPRQRLPAIEKKIAIKCLHLTHQLFRDMLKPTLQTLFSALVFFGAMWTLSAKELANLMDFAPEEKAQAVLAREEYQNGSYFKYLRVGFISIPKDLIINNEEGGEEILRENIVIGLKGEVKMRFLRLTKNSNKP